ncbi:lysophospholipid transporter LplT [Pseudomonas sp. S 311-6]|uniref:lysophospholipid transporter LplT n=1 Tax=Kerstersia gyiorum TaxID=206506 RepID=UPI002096A7D9|nr:lysophospholipid transporter LplT [Kerstersia gyiorum]MCH4271641.1 lysophospholipid transporter LplT [Kerstersia gyiorum]MCI1227583.1 lysophospholipid transporter LplT [Kerstersia gyiorum]MCO7635552.1 lysophospholipid transporter LplT [Pseudomonas sp. S 311-6]
MKRGFYLVMAAQALSSLADNALFIAALALIQELSGPDWMAPMLKWWFALAYVLLAAFVGAFADSVPKGRVMLMTNALKTLGCIIMLAYTCFGMSSVQQTWLICGAYALVGIGAAAYSPAKYGIVTEMLPPSLLVKGNSWIEGLTVTSIIIGTVLGGALISPHVSSLLLTQTPLGSFLSTPAEAAIFCIVFIYVGAAICNLLIPHTGYYYPKQPRQISVLLRTFFGYVGILWRDKLGRISLAITTLFWGAGATLQLIVIEWGHAHLGLRLDQASVLMGISAFGTVVGAILAGRLPLQKSLVVLPLGAVMGLLVLCMPMVSATYTVYTLLFLIGAAAGYFVVPMNALLQHRGHVLLSAGHSIAVQNFNEQINILFMVALYTLLLKMELHINTIITIFGLAVFGLMTLIIVTCKLMLHRDPSLEAQIGQTGHGQALK